MEELINEQAVGTARAAEAEKGKEGAEVAATSLKKFRDVQSLEKAYGSLEAEFTKRCQRIRELEGRLFELEEAKANAEKNLPTHAGGILDATLDFCDEKAEGGGEENGSAKKEVGERGVAEPREKTETDDERAYLKELLKRVERLEKSMDDEEFLLGKIEGSSVKDRIIREYLAGVKNLSGAPRLTGSGGSIAVLPPVKPKTLSEAAALAKEYVKIK